MSYFTSRLRLAAPLAIGAALLPFVASAQVASTSPLITSVQASTSATMADITWTTDVPSGSWVGYGTSSPIAGVYATSTTASTSQVTSHKVTLMGLMPTTSYHFQVVSQNGTSTDPANIASTTAYSGDLLFLTMSNPATTSTSTSGTGTSTIPIEAIQNFITQLSSFQSQIGQWISQLLTAIGNGGGNPGGGTGTTTPSGGATIEQPGNVRAGTNVDFSGHGFGSEEYVKVSRGGTQVATAFSNIGGGFSTGSISVGNTTGTFVYTFVGQTSGKTTTATVTVTP